MKKIVFLAVTTVLSFTINAQDEGVSSSQFGVKAGFNSLSLRVSAEGASESESVSGFYVGVFGEFEVSKKLDIQPELQYVNVSEDGESSGFLVLPILAKYNASEQFSILAGPQLDYLLDEEDGGLSKLGLGLATGLAYNINEDFIIDARYAFGLSNRSKDLDFFEGFDIKTTFNYVQVGLGYRF
jgi:opacity protein-like surface antigen